MKVFLRAVTVGIVAILMLGMELPAQSADPVVGTWKLNVAKSKFSPGPAPKSETRTYAVAGQDIKGTAKGVDSSGKPTASEWTMNYDGKDRPFVGSQDADTLSLKRVDASSAEFTQKKAGKVVITGTRSISQDGKVMTITSKGTNAGGQAISNVQVFEKR